MNTDKFYTLEEVAKILQTSKRMIVRMIYNHKLRAINVSAGDGLRPNWRIYQKEIDRFISEEYEKNSN